MNARRFMSASQHVQFSGRDFIVFL